MLSTALASDPHPHQGILDPYVGAPQRPELTEADLARLAAGHSVLKQEQFASGTDAAGRGIAILDVHADPAIVWSKLTDYASYPDMVDHVKLTEPYETVDDHVKVRFIIGAPLINIEYYIDHTLCPDEGWLTWRLDYARESDFDDSVGFWLVEALPDRPGWSRVYHATTVQARGWVPPFIERAFAKIGLKTSVGWLKREAEAEAGR